MEANGLLGVKFVTKMITEKMSINYFNMLGNTFFKDIKILCKVYRQYLCIK